MTCEVCISSVHSSRKPSLFYYFYFYFEVGVCTPWILGLTPLRRSLCPCTPPGGGSPWRTPALGAMTTGTPPTMRRGCRQTQTQDRPPSPLPTNTQGDGVTTCPQHTGSHQSCGSSHLGLRHPAAAHCIRMWQDGGRHTRGLGADPPAGGPPQCPGSEKTIRSSCSGYGDEPFQMKWERGKWMAETFRRDEEIGRVPPAGDGACPKRPRDWS